MDPNTHHNIFPIRHSVCTNLKTTGCTWVFYIPNNCFTIQDVFFCVRARCELQLVSYSSKHASQCLCNKQFVHGYGHNLKTTGHIWTFYISSNNSTIRDIPWVLWSCMRDLTGELRLQTCISLSQIQHYVSTCILQSRIYASTHDNKTHVPYDCIHTTHQTTALLPKMRRFIRGLLASSWVSCATHLSLFN